MLFLLLMITRVNMQHCRWTFATERVGHLLCWRLIYIYLKEVLYQNLSFDRYVPNKSTISLRRRLAEIFRRVGSCRGSSVCATCLPLVSAQQHQWQSYVITSFNRVLTLLWKFSNQSFLTRKILAEIRYAVVDHCKYAAGIWWNEIH